MSDALRNFGKKPLQYQVGVFVGIGVVLLGLYWYLFYGDISEELGKQQKQVSALATQKQTLQATLVKRQELLKTNKQMKDKLTKDKEALPTTSELPAFFRHLDRQAAVAGVTITSRALAPEQKVNPYIKVPVKIQLTGSFYQIMNYFSLLGDKKKTRRIISVSGLVLGNGKRSNDENVLRASFVASTFRLNEPDQPKSAPAPAPAPEEKKNVVEQSKDKVEKVNEAREKQLDDTGADGPAPPGGTPEAPPADGTTPENAADKPADGADGADGAEVTE